MKKLIIFLLLSIPAWATKTLTSSVAFTDAQGTALANGYLIFQLNAGARAIVGGQIVPIASIKINLDATGKVVAAQVIFANDELTPTGTYYITKVFNQNDELVRGPENWILSGASPIDLSLESNSTLPDPGLSNPILSNPAGPQTITGQSLTLSSSAPLIANGTFSASNVTKLQLAAASNIWIDVMASPYGAKCDGATDDTTAIQNALNAANGPTGGGTVFLPRTGTPCVVSALTMDNMNNVTVQSAFNWSPQGGNASQATLKFTGTCNPNACLSMKSTADVRFRGVQLSFPNATLGPMIDLSHSGGNGDTVRDGFHGVGFIGPGPSIGPIILAQNVDFLTFDGWTQFNNASVFVEGPVNNAANFSDTVVFNNVVFQQPGTAAIQNASVAWSIVESNFALVTGTTCAAALQYVGGYTNQQNLTFTGNSFLYSAASCSGATTIISVPAAAATFGALVFQGNLIAGPTAPANLNFLSSGNGQVLSISGNVFNNLNTVFTVGTTTVVDIGPNEYNSITTFLSGTPANGRYLDNTGKTFFAGGLAPDGSGFKHKRFASPLGGTCPTGAAIGNACTSANLNWTTAFADNNYSVTCSLDSVTNQPHIVNVTKQAAGAGITVTIATDLASAANAGVECIAIHD